MFCTKCGAKNPDEYSFCMKCGTPLKSSNLKTKNAGTQPSLTQRPNTVSPIRQNGPTATAVPFPSTPAPATATASSAGINSADAPRASKKRGKRIAIIIVAIALVAIAAVCSYLFIFSAKPCYRVKSSTFYGNAGKFESTNNSYYQDGALEQVLHSVDGKTSTVNYTKLSDGFSIAEGNTGTFTTNADGYLSTTTIKNVSSNTEYTTTYEYYEPGIIKKVSISYSDGSMQATEYDKDGWRTAFKKTNSKGEKLADYYYTHESSENGKVIKVNSYNDASHTQGQYVAYTLDLDDTGNIATAYVRENKSDILQTFTYEKIEAPDKMAIALARLKAY